MNNIYHLTLSNHACAHARARATERSKSNRLLPGPPGRRPGGVTPNWLRRPSRFFHSSFEPRNDKSHTCHGHCLFLIQASVPDGFKFPWPVLRVFAACHNKSCLCSSGATRTRIESLPGHGHGAGGPTTEILSSGRLRLTVRLTVSLSRL